MLPSFRTRAGEQGRTACLPPLRQRNHLLIVSNSSEGNCLVFPFQFVELYSYLRDGGRSYLTTEVTPTRSLIYIGRRCYPPVSLTPEGLECPSGH